METKNYPLVLAVALVLLLILSGGFKPNRLSYGRVGGINIQTPGFEQAGLVLPLASDRKLPEPAKDGPLPELELQAKAALVKDKNSPTKLYQKNPDLALGMASLTKLLTALVAVKSLPLQEIVEIKLEDTQVSPYRAGLLPGEKLRVKDLLQAMLVASANDATLALARSSGGSVVDFTSLMNQQAKTLGMRSSSFTNPVGFDDPKHYATARDLALLAEEFLDYPEMVFFTAIQKTDIFSVDGRSSHELLTTNKLLLQYPQVRGLKTGYTAEAGGNLIILVEQPGEERGYYFIILGSPDREADAQAILKWVEENWEWS